MKNNQRKQMIDSVIDLCVKKQWWEADELFDKYRKIVMSFGNSTILYLTIKLINAAFVER